MVTVLLSQQDRLDTKLAKEQLVAHLREFHQVCSHSGTPLTELQRVHWLMHNPANGRE
jgi:hypothetical protein